jgi:hypothetical protein
LQRQPPAIDADYVSLSFHCHDFHEAAILRRMPRFLRLYFAARHIFSFSFAFDD